MNIEARSTRLRKLGLVPTVQRSAVLEFLEKNHTHPTAEEVYQGVRDQFPSLAKATVYNVLDALKKAGGIQELTIARAAARYDYNSDPHPHFLCRVCGNLYDVDLPCSIRPGDKIGGHRVEVARTYLYGICAQCQKQRSQNKNESKIGPGCSSASTKRRNDAGAS